MLGVDEGDEGLPARRRVATAGRNEAKFLVEISFLALVLFIHGPLSKELFYLREKEAEGERERKENKKNSRGPGTYMRMQGSSIIYSHSVARLFLAVPMPPLDAIKVVEGVSVR